jgi:hypothetical protein
MPTNIMFDNLSYEDKQKLFYSNDTVVTIEYTDGTIENDAIINVIMKQFPVGTLIYLPLPGTPDTFVVFKK